MSDLRRDGPFDSISRDELLALQRKARERDEAVARYDRLWNECGVAEAQLAVATVTLDSVERLARSNIICEDREYTADKIVRIIQEHRESLPSRAKAYRDVVEAAMPLGEWAKQLTGAAGYGEMCPLSTNPLGFNDDVTPTVGNIRTLAKALAKLEETT